MIRRAAASSGASKIAIPVLEPAERRPHEDDDAFGEESLAALEVGGPGRLFLGGHRRREVLARRMDEVDPLGRGVLPAGGAGPRRS
jgi:hypothetical protein